MTIKKKVLQYIRTHEGTTFVELENLFEALDFDYKGDLAQNSQAYENLIYWTGWNEKAVAILKDLEEKNLIRHDRVSEIYYIVDGKTLRLPIAGKLTHFKNVHWLPIAFTALSKTETAQAEKGVKQK